jgi:thiol-disulfide isomerase/thioredoxin
MFTKGRKLAIIFSVLIVGVMLASSSTRGADEVSSQKHDQSFAVFQLPVPENQKEREYLGLTGKDDFKVGQIKAGIVLIEVLSMYCPHCQHTAPLMEKVYDQIEGRADLKGRIKIIGIGMGNNAYELKLFKEKYKVSFPLFPDERVRISDLLGVTGTPTFIGVKVGADGKAEQFFLSRGAFDDPASFFDGFLEAAGIKQTT